MPLTLHYHPLSSFCQKVLIALYENATAFTPHLVDLMNPDSRAAFLKIWPIGKFPVLCDGDTVVPESSIIIEYLDRKYPGATRFIPDDTGLARAVRLADRFYDLYLDEPLGRIAGQRMRPEADRDAAAIEQAKALMRTALGTAEKDMASRTFAAGETFSMADCAAAPALFYANMVIPFADTHPAMTAYLNRLKVRPSFARALREAEPYLHLVPK